MWNVFLIYNAVNNLSPKYYKEKQQRKAAKKKGSWKVPKSLWKRKKSARYFRKAKVDWV